MRQSLLGLFFVSQLFLGCSILPSNYSIRIWELGKVEATDFDVALPMETRMGLRIIQVEIEGERYDFLIDAGAPTLLSPELFQKLGIKSKEVIAIRDSQGHRAVGKLGVLPAIEIGGISFKNIGVVSYQINQHYAISCLKIDGIIGSNLMQHAIWQFDFVQNQLKLYSKAPDGLSNAMALSVDVQKRPYVNISPAEGMHFSALLDLGFSGMLDLPDTDYQVLQEKEELLFPQEAFGANSYGLIGKQDPDTLRFAILPRLKLGDSYHTPARAEFSKANSRMIGMGLFEKNTLTLDWKTRKIYVEETESEKSVELSHFGFKPGFQSDHLTVDLMFANSIAKELGLSLGDTITHLNGRSFVNIAIADYCHFLTSKEESADTITVEVKRGPTFQEFKLPVATFLYSEME